MVRRFVIAGLAAAALGALPAAAATQGGIGAASQGSLRITLVVPPRAGKDPCKAPTLVEAMACSVNGGNLRNDIKKRSFFIIFQGNTKILSPE